MLISICDWFLFVCWEQDPIVEAGPRDTSKIRQLEAGLACYTPCEESNVGVEFGRFLLGRAPWTPDALLRAAGQKLPALRALLDSVLVTVPLPFRELPSRLQISRA